MRPGEGAAMDNAFDFFRVKSAWAQILLIEGVYRAGTHQAAARRAAT
jgi:hypothetical protein